MRIDSTIISELTRAVHRYGSAHVVAGDILAPKLTYRQLLIRTHILSSKLAPKLEGQKNVAIMLPNALGVMITFVALHVLHKLPCMLNFSAGIPNIKHACQIANVKTILTSRTFIEKAGLEELAAALEKDYNVFYLEDIKPEVTVLDKIKGLFKAMFIPLKDPAMPDEPAVILYTSGSEGKPKGVALSHSNIISNIEQSCNRLKLSKTDSVFNALPTFHSFGLTVGMLLPMLRGMRSFLYPSPLHYKEIPKMVYKTGCTIMMGTDTFYKGYARFSKKKYYKTIRFGVAGAEKLRAPTREHWKNELGVTILEGYGVTETSPVLSVNTPKDNKQGTVGTLMDGIEAKLEAVEGLDEGGRLFVKGPNVMLGYLDPENPGQIKRQGEWYDTGDIVTIADGYVTIEGRAKRFAKIGGEMVSLQAVENYIIPLTEEAIAAVSIPDDKKGERIILYSQDKTLQRDAVIAEAKKQSVADLAIPKEIRYIEEIPLLGTGKINYPALLSAALADSQTGQ